MAKNLRTQTLERIAEHTRMLQEWDEALKSGKGKDAETNRAKVKEAIEFTGFVTKVIGEVSIPWRPTGLAAAVVSEDRKKEKIRPAAEEEKEEGIPAKS